MHERLLLRHRFAKLARLSALVGHFCAGDTRWDLQQSLPHQVGPKASVYTSLQRSKVQSYVLALARLSSIWLVLGV